MSVEAAFFEDALHVLSVVFVCPSGFAQCEKYAESIFMKLVALEGSAIFVLLAGGWVLSFAASAVAVLSVTFFAFFVSLTFVVFVFVVAVRWLPILFFLFVGCVVLLFDVVDCSVLRVLLVTYCVVVHVLQYLDQLVAGQYPSAAAF